MALRSRREYLGLALRGMAMGAADVVPGVSGGTIAFITGIYEELIDSLRRIDHRALACLFQRGPVAAWEQINGSFLLAVFGGILLSVVSLAKVISLGLSQYPILVWSFFFGLILASSLHLSRNINLRRIPVLLIFLLGVGLAVTVSIARPASLPGEWWMVMAAGSVAICAMILPGISGSFMLVLMGMYGVILEALTSLNLLLLASFGGGCVLGLLAFSHLLNWLLQRFHELTLALLTGFILGSLSVIWPWKQVLSTRLDRHGELVPVVQTNVLPATFEQVTGHDAQLLMALVLLVAGFMLVLGLERLFQPQVVEN